MQHAILTRSFSGAPSQEPMYGPSQEPDRTVRHPEAAESTGTVVIGSGLSGLAVASELSRRGVDAIVVEGLSVLDGCSRLTAPADAGTHAERCELLRLLRGYAASHALDIRRIFAEDLQQVNSTGTTGSVGASASGSAAGPDPAAAPARKWAVSTAAGILLADNVVLTGCPRNQLRRLVRSLGLAVGRDFAGALRSAGLHLVGVGDLLAPSAREIAHQAKLVTEAIAAQPGQRLRRHATAQPC